MKSPAQEAAIAGVGFAPITRSATLSKEAMSVLACKEALVDAGVNVDQVDGVFHWSISGPESPKADVLAAAVGARNVEVRLDFGGHGTNTSRLTVGGATGIVMAAMAVASGSCRVALVYRCVSRSMGAFGGGGSAEAAPPALGVAQFDALYGKQPHAVIDSAGQVMRRLKWKYGIREEDFGIFAVNARRWAALNERAIMRAPLTLDEYLASRFVSDPCRLLDCDYPVNGAVAFVITSLEQARDLLQPPVVIDGWAHNTAPPDDVEEYWQMRTIKTVSSSLWRRSSVSVRDVDTAQLYDGFTVMALNWLWALGLCKPEETAAFLDEGRTIGLGGRLPTNTSGGQLAEGRLHLFGLVAEAANQIRGRCGDRQVRNAQVAVVTYGGTVQDGAWAAILRADR